MSFHYVYILRSVSHTDQTYVGLTDDLKARLARHNKGGSSHTSKFGPWEIETAVAFASREKAAGSSGGGRYALAERGYPADE